MANGGVPVYRGDPRAWALSQVDDYWRDPKAIRLGSRPSPIVDEDRNAHVSNSNKAMRILEGEPKELPESLPDFVDLMMMLGCGMGYQIEALLERTEIRHLCIIEPEPDIFYASLLTIDWIPIIRHFSQDGRSLELLVGVSPDACYARFNTWVAEIGGFNLAQPYVFQHLVGPKTAACFEPFQQRIMPERINFLGYFDDEQVGLAHTIKNLEAEVPVLRRGEQPDTRGRPAFIVANGPSLDESLECIREFRDCVVLISCGTTLGSLIKAGIRPDIHVEMERAGWVQEWIRLATSQEDRDEMIILGLNTVHPAVYRLFPWAGMTMKPNDVGTAYVEGRVSFTGEVVQLPECNPTVANCATSLAAELGFEEVYLFGFDFGFPDGEKHHSELSIHYDVKVEQRGELGLYLADDSKNITGQGNFGGTVATTTLFVKDAQSVARVVAAHPGMTCVHTGAGLKIEGTHPVRPHEVRLENAPFDTQAVARSIVDQSFGLDGLRAPDPSDVEAVFSRTAEALAELEGIAGGEVRTVQEGLDVLAGMHRLVLTLLCDDRDRYVGAMLKGSVAVFSLLLAQALHRTRDPERNLTLYRDCRGLFLSFCRMARTIVSSDLLTPDERRRDLLAKLG